MKKLVLIGIFMSSLILGGSVAAEACGHKPASCMTCAMKEQQCKISKLKKQVKPLWKNKEALGLTKDQLEKIKEAKHAAIKKLIQLDADKEIVMVDLKSAMYQSKMNVPAVDKLIDAKYAAKTKAAKTYVKALGDIQSILNEKQREQWLEMRKTAESDKGGCTKCDKAKGDKVCPITGKPLNGKGLKGSRK